MKYIKIFVSFVYSRYTVLVRDVGAVRCNFVKTLFFFNENG